MAGTIANWLRIPALASGAVAVAGSFLLYFKQNELIYPRNIPFDSRTEAAIPRPEQFGIEASNYLDLRIPTPDGESLAAYYIRPSRGDRASQATIIMFHGNAGNIGHRLPIAKALADMNRLNVLMVEYRGYGLSTGTPDEKGLNIDSQAGLDWVRNYADEAGEKDGFAKRGGNDYGKGKVIIYAQSIGGAVAIQLAARNQASGDVLGLILENTFLSIKKLIPRFVQPIYNVCNHMHINDGLPL
jgi:abhydrolase domain-containing protein 13